jgi:hypothetical protein
MPDKIFGNQSPAKPRGLPESKPKIVTPEPKRPRVSVSHHEEEREWNWPLITGVVFGLIVIIFFLIPAFRGYLVYREMQASGVPDEYVTHIDKLLQDKAAAEELAKSTQVQLADVSERNVANEHKLAAAREDVNICNEKRTADQKKHEQSIESLHNDVAAAEADVVTCEKEASQKIDQTTAILMDAAKRLCCVQRAITPELDSFSIVEGKVLCSTGGQNPITC